MSSDATVVALHPEDLVESERRGTALSAAETALLEQHRLECAACRLEALATPEFEHVLRPRAGDAHRLAAITAAALAATSVPATAAAIASAPTKAIGVGRLLTVVSTFLVGVTVVALWWSGGGRGEIESLALSSPGGLAPLRHEKEAIDVPRTTIVMQPRTTTGTIDEPTSEPSAARHAPPRSAAELFSEANEARRAGDLPRATRLYDELVRLHRGSREEVLARATRGRMLLDQGKHAKQALALFDSYLKSSPEGTLAEEALAGRARALGQLGRDSEEAKAWRTLLERHPDTLHRALARERLASLGESLP